MKKIILLLLLSLPPVLLFNGCGNSITGTFETVKAQSIELTDGTDVLAKINAAKLGDGTIIVTIKDKNGNIIGTISAK
jgi:hypothetical protein